MKWKTETDKSPPIVTPVEPSVKQRDSKGKFIHGNTPINKRDRTTGKFTKELKTPLPVTLSKDRHSKIVSEIDKLLEQ